jgi:hypothetical protein
LRRRRAAASGEIATPLRRQCRGGTAFPGGDFAQRCGGGCQGHAATRSAQRPSLDNHHRTGQIGHYESADYAITAVNIRRKSMTARGPAPCAQSTTISRALWPAAASCPLTFSHFAPSRYSPEASTLGRRQGVSAGMDGIVAAIHDHPWTDQTDFSAIFRIGADESKPPPYSPGAGLGLHREESIGRQK